MRQLEAMKDARNDLHNKLGYAFDGLVTELQKEINKVIDELLGGYEKNLWRKDLWIPTRKRSL